MPLNATRKLIESHLESGEMTPGEEIAIHIDQTLTQDATDVGDAGTGGDWARLGSYRGERAIRRP